MSNEGFDIVGQVIDKTAPGVASIKQNLGGLETHTKSLTQQYSQLSQTMSMLRGGAMVGAFVGVTSELERAANKLVEIRDLSSQVNLSGYELASAYASAVPVLGRLFEAGERAGNAIANLWHGVQVNTGASSAATREYLNLQYEIIEVQDRLTGQVVDRTASIGQEIGDIERLMSMGLEHEDTLKREVSERNAIASATARQAQEVKQLEDAQNKMIESVLNQGGDLEGTMAKNENKTQEIRKAHEKELDELRRRHAADRALAEFRDRDKAARELAQVEAKERERLMRESFAAQNDEMNRMSQIAGKLAPGTHAGRFETGKLDTAREARQREAEREQRRIQEEQKRLLERIAAATENQTTPQPVNI